MSKINFTADRVLGFKCEGGKQQAFFWDGKAPGLGLRITAAGAKSYIFETRLHGKTLRITIGSALTWTVVKAQAEATRLKSLTDQGTDPRQEAENARAKAEAAHAEVKRQVITVGEVWPVYLAARKGKWGKRSYDDHIKLSAPGGEPYRRGTGVTIPGPIAALLPLRMCDLTSDAMASWLERESATRPTVAASSFRVIRAFIRWAAQENDYEGLILPKAYSASKVRELVQPSLPKEGDCLQREQLQDWFFAVRKISNPVISVFLQALLLTGSRREEMAVLRWEDIDFRWRSLTIRDKIEGTRIIPLTPYLASLFLGLKQLNDAAPSIRQLKSLRLEVTDWKPSPWVFRSRRAESGRLTEPTKAHNDALAVAGLPHLSIHGLRRSFGTLAEWMELPAGVVAQIQGHKPSAIVEKHYRRRSLDLLRKFHDQIEAWVLEEAGIHFQPAPARLRVVTVA